jgi:hypothetical protein
VIAGITSTYLLDIYLVEEHRNVYRKLPKIEENYENKIKQMKLTEKTESDTSIKLKIN